MSDVDRLLAAFASGERIRPSADTANLIDLVTAIGATAGIPGPALEGHAGAIAERLAGAEHIVFVLADGLGMQFIDALPPEAWLRRQLVQPLLAPFPSTTAVSITSIATGRWLTDHASPGWWAYIPARDLIAVPLPFHRLSDERPLEDLGIEPGDLFPVPSMVPRMRFAAQLVLPAAIADSTYSRYLGGTATRAGYDTLSDAVDHIVARIEAATEPTYTYWYISRVDTLAHELGTKHERTTSAVRDVDERLATLAARLIALPAAVRIVVTADHGHLNVPDGGRQMLATDDPIMNFLRVHPTGDVRVAYFHLRENADDRTHAAFRKLFAARFANWVLLTADDVDALRLMGPRPLSAETRARIGDYTAIALNAEVMRYAGVPGADRFMRQQSQHSGLSPSEMTIPLVIAGG